MPGSSNFRPATAPLAATALIALAAVLIGFHVTTMTLSAVSLSPAVTQTAKLDAPPRPAPIVKHDERRTPDQHREAPFPLANPTGVAAAAKAKAQAEMDELEGAAAPADTSASPRFRPPRIDEHKVY